MCVSSNGGSMIRWNSARDEGVKILWNARLSCHDRVVAPSRAELCVLLVVLNGVPDGAALTEVDLSELGIAGALTNHPHAQHLAGPTTAWRPASFASVPPRRIRGKRGDLTLRGSSFFAERT
jgi:hypothetical protein